MHVIALYTDVDRDAPFVRHADMAYRLPMRGTAVEAYLDHDGLLATLERCDADAVWPGWGFVAESPEFVDRLASANIRFLGPSASTMRALGDKIASKELAERVGVPVTRWSGGVVADVAAAERHAGTVGFPLVVKASAGGGGRGIRMVHAPEELSAAFRSAASEAKTAFGDDRLFIEAMVRGGRHIEVQIVADTHGHVRALGCRDCSVQRRHQKVIEEAPPVGLSEAMLRDMMRSAERLAAEVGYSGVGTVEFLVRESEFFFLEMNPRLQVEHGITEELCGLDLVEQQIRIARGESIAELLPEPGAGPNVGQACIEARVCAEDPDQGFLPAPGRIALFEPALGPNLRIDTGVTEGSLVPPDFDSLIAKVMAKGRTRREARTRLKVALRDFDLVIDGGATNKSYLLDVLEAEEYARGGVDTLWLDRFTAARRDDERPYAVEALVFAAILAYRERWRAERRDFFRDTSNVTSDKVPSLQGMEFDLEYAGEQYRTRVFSVGSMRYRVHMDGRVISARFGDRGDHTARMVIYGRYMRAVYDISETYLHVEIEGAVHRFGRQTAGQVRAGAPSMVVSLNVEEGSQVQAGEALGLLEAMKMEVAFTAPVPGTVTEVRVKKGQQVAPGEVLVVIDPATDLSEGGRSVRRLQLPAETEHLAVLFESTPGGGLGAPDLPAADRAPEAARLAAMAAVNEEISRLMLGYDILPSRFEKILEFLEAPLPAGLSEAFRSELAEVGHQLTVFADVDSLFSRSRPVTEGGSLDPSNNARLRMYLRRMRSGPTGISEDFLEMLRTALSHYEVHSLDYSDRLERSLLRMFASQREPADRHRLAMALLRRVIALLASGLALTDDAGLQRALLRIAALRGDVPNTLVDTALETHYLAFDAPEVAAADARTARRLEGWLSEASADVAMSTFPEEVLDDLAVAPPTLFRSVRAWIGAPDPSRRLLGLAAHMRRLYAPKVPHRHSRIQLIRGFVGDLLEFNGSQRVLGVCAMVPDIAGATAALVAGAASEAIDALELVVFVGEGADTEVATAEVAKHLPAELPSARLTISFVTHSERSTYETFTWTDGRPARVDLYKVHPEAASRIDLDRYRKFELERLWASEGLYCFIGRARNNPEDVRVFVLADVRGRTPDNSHDATLFVPMFERAFQEATRTMRLVLSTRDPRRQLYWNRIVMHMAQPILLEAKTAQQLARRLLAHVRHLGVEKTIVRLRLLSPDRPKAQPRVVEAVFADLASSRLEMLWRRPRRRALEPATEYERTVAVAKRRGLVYPYEIVRMLTHGDEATERALEVSDTDDTRPVLPVGDFEEFDLDPSAAQPTAVSVGSRAPGKNVAAIVFGIISTPTPKVPEGMRRVLIMADPTRAMGALAPPECDRVIAAIDMAEQQGLPVEWIAVSGGARIAMDSGTENLDATARVVKRIVTFTQARGVIHVIVTGVNVGAQSYWDSLATMLMHTRGVLIMTPTASMVLTGPAALAASGSVSAEDDLAIGGHEQIMGPNGEAQFFAPDLLRAYRILYDHYDFTYVVPGEGGPRLLDTTDPWDRDITRFPYVVDSHEQGGFQAIGEVFDPETNPGRKRPFAMRALMQAVIDQDGGRSERWASHVGAETAIVWDAHLGGRPVCLLGMESQNLPRLGYRPLDGPEQWNGGTLFPQSSKKVARALNAASGNRPVVILASLSGFDGSPESMRKLQLEYGAEIARAVVNFDGPIAFLVVSRYHGGAYVVFSRELNPGLRVLAVEGSFASVIGGGPAATVVFPREVRARVASDPRVQELQAALRDAPTAEARATFERVRHDITLEKRAELAAEFDAIHSVERAREVGSLEAIIGARQIRPRLIELITGTD